MQGCKQNVDLAAVKQFVDTTNTAAQSFSVVADDYYGSCARDIEYRRRKLFASTPIARPSSEAANFSPALPTMPTNLHSDPRCELSAVLADRWNLENGVIVAYVRALGAISGANAQPKNLDILASRLHDVGIINNDNVAKAAGSLATTMAAEFAKGRQRAAIRDFVIAADPDIRVLVDGLHDIVVVNYKTLLKNEQIDLDTLFRGGIRRQTPRGNLEDILPLYFQREGWAARRAAVTQREKSADSYAAAIHDIGSVHAELVRNADSSSQAIVVAVVKSYVDDLSSDVANLVNALRKGGD